MCHTFSLYRLSALAAIWTTGDRRGPRGAQSPITALRIIKNRSHYKIIAIVRNYKLPEICKLSGSPWWTDHAGDSIIGSSSLYISPNCRSGQTDGSSNHPLISSYGSSKSSWLYVNFFIYPLRTSFGKFSAYIVNCKPRQPAMFTSSANQRENHRALLNIVYQHRIEFICSNNHLTYTNIKLNTIDMSRTTRQVMHLQLPFKIYIRWKIKHLKRTVCKVKKLKTF